MTTAMTAAAASLLLEVGQLLMTCRTPSSRMISVQAVMRIRIQCSFRPCRLQLIEHQKLCRRDSTRERLLSFQSMLPVTP